ncbi:hypothetical protein M8J76_006523 [Diaphorina citri]|nr:hypothetical protein M8J76_006523 [Diaphorina citri]KAI5751364.1 hypothetical protein M8J77_006792 [Diaphorina citri]
MTATALRSFLFVTLITFVICSPLRTSREANAIIDVSEDKPSASIDPATDTSKQDLIPAETFWGPGPGPWGPPPPWAWGPFGPGPFGPFGPGPFGPFGPGPSGPGFATVLGVGAAYYTWLPLFNEKHLKEKNLISPKVQEPESQTSR